MTVGENLSTFAGRPVRNYEHGKAFDDNVVYRLTQDYEDEQPQAELLGEFLDAAPLATLDALVLGNWHEAYEIPPTGLLETLIAQRKRLGALRALFAGDISGEECEISWIIQTSYKALLDSFQQLEVLRIRGSTQLVVPAFEHHHLRELAIESGGLPVELVHNLAQSRLPALKHLELWLGDENYGFSGGVADYRQLLARLDGSRLHYLGLRNAPISDELAVWLAQEPWIARLQTLDLSMGTLGDVGAHALLHSPHVRGLKRLELSHHYISAELQAQLRKLPLEVVLDDPQDADEDGDRYVEVSE